jgi:hypothetical protein
MQYSTFHSLALARAGLVALNILLVSAAPLIPATSSVLSSCNNPSLNGRQQDFLFSGRISTPPFSTRLIFEVRYSYQLGSIGPGLPFM